MYRNLILFVCLLLMVPLVCLSQTTEKKAQLYLDSLIRLTAKTAINRFEYYDAPTKIGDGFSITTGQWYIDCNKYFDTYVETCPENRKGIIKPSGQKILPMFTQVERLSGNRFFLSTENLQCITDFSFRVLKSFDLVEFSEDGFHKVIYQGKSGIVDKDFREVVPIKYDFVQNFDLYGRAVVRTGKDGWKILDQDSLLTGKKREDEFGRMIQLIKIKENGKWGLVNERGQLVTPIKYDDVTPYPGGYAAAMILIDGDLSDVKWAVINYEGKEITPFKYSEIIQHYTWNYSQVDSGDVYGFIDEKGKEVTPIKYSGIGSDFFYYEGVGNYVLALEKEGKYGILDQYGKEIVPMIYEEIDGCWDCEGGMKGKINGEWKVIPVPLKK